jgi:hypothetical protein
LTKFIFSQHFLSNFFKEFYNWLTVSDNEAQRPDMARASSLSNVGNVSVIAIHLADY